MKKITAKLQNLDLSRAGLQRGATALLIMVWVWGWVLLGAWTVDGVSAVWDWFKTTLFGLVGVLTVGFVYAKSKGQPGQMAVGFLMMGFIPVLCVSAWFSHSLPLLLASFEVTNQPVSLDLDTLRYDRPDLPAYAQIRGYPRRDLTLSIEYKLYDAERNRSETRFLRLVPLVGSRWNSDQPVYVLTELDVVGFYASSDEEKSVEGILFPARSRPGERAWSNKPVGVDQLTADWLTANADFNANPDHLYILTDETPFTLRGLFIIFTILTIGFMGLVLYLVLDKSVVEK